MGDILELVLVMLWVFFKSSFEPIYDWINRTMNKKTKKYNKRLGKMITFLAHALFIGSIFGLVVAVIISYLQRINAITPIFGTALANLFLIINIIFLVSTMLFIAFSKKVKHKKYILNLIWMIILIGNILIISYT